MRRIKLTKQAKGYLEWRKVLTTKLYLPSTPASEKVSIKRYLCNIESKLEAMKGLINPVSDKDVVLPLFPTGDTSILYLLTNDCY